MSSPHPENLKNDPIEGFWRRLGALLLDGVVLFIFGTALSGLLVYFSLDIGPWGRLIGFAVILVYFGTLNSKVGKGQTVGKRILGMAVRDKQGKPITLGLSLLRTLILAIPFLLSGWKIPVHKLNHFLQLFLSVIAFGVPLCLAYTTLFNRVTRQYFHDLLCRTYVIRAANVSITPLQKTARTHFVVIAVLPILVLVAVAWPTKALPFDPERLRAFQESLSKDPRFWTISVQHVITTPITGNLGSDRALIVEAWHKVPLSTEESIRIVRGLAETSLIQYGNINEIDRIQVSVTWGVDLLISTWMMTSRDSQTKEYWRKALHLPLLNRLHDLGRLYQARMQKYQKQFFLITPKEWEKTI